MSNPRTQDVTTPRRSRRTGRSKRCIVVPTSLRLTSKVLADAALKLTTPDICYVMDRLVEGLDFRDGDPDLEPETLEEDSDLEPEALEDAEG
jgi:hypothetical protein